MRRSNLAAFAAMVALVVAAGQLERALACEKEASNLDRSSVCSTCEFYSCDSSYTPPAPSGPNGRKHNPPIACFAVIEDGPNFVLFDDTDSTTFERWTSADQGVSWVQQADATGLAGGGSGIWNIQCPDPILVGNQMWMYYNAKDSVDFEVWRAVSNDGGATFSGRSKIFGIDRTGPCHFPYMPSVVQRGDGTFLMSFFWTCTDTDTRLFGNSEIQFYMSRDGRTNWQQVTDGMGNAVTIPRGACDEHDGGSANRARLLLDFDGNRIHCFYSSYPIDPINLDRPSRVFGGIGHYYSDDGGTTWNQFSGQLHQPRYPYEQHALKPSVVKYNMAGSGARVFRLYFEGAGTDTGLYSTVYRWKPSWPNCSGCPETQPIRTPIADIDTNRQTSARIVSVPNPTSAGVRVSLEFTGRRPAGDVALLVYDVRGRVVRRLWAGASSSAPDAIPWDGTDEEGSTVAAGRYLVLARQNGETIGSEWITTLR